MVKTRITDFQTHDETPFIILEGMEYRKYWTKEAAEEVVDKNGEIYQMIKSVKSITGFKDTSTYSKLFTGGKLKLSELNSAGIRVLSYILLNTKPNAESVCLYPPTVAKDMGYKNQKNVYDGLLDLLQKDLIARCVGNQSCFWINPNLVFNGDRRKLLENPVRAVFAHQLEQNWNKKVKEFVLTKKD